MPIKFEYIEDKYIITAIDETLNIGPFPEILKINNVDVRDYLHKKIVPLCWREIEKSARIRYINMIPLIEESGGIEILTDNGFYKVPFIKNINPKSFIDVNMSEETKKIYESKALEINETEDDINIIKINSSIDLDTKDEFYLQLPIINESKGIILDIRENIGGMTKIAATIAQAFIKGKLYGV